MGEKNIKMIIEYDGSAYHGWQFQENAVTIQDTLEQAIEALCGEKTRVTASGRTDAGVHARGQTVNFKMKKEMPLHSIKNGLNNYLPEDIVVRSVAVVSGDFNSRFDARQRIYQYYVSTERTALRRRYCWQMLQHIDTDLLNPLAARLIGTHDFGAFCRAVVQSKDKICSVQESQWQQNGSMWVYRVAANRFLHGMVRSIVGTIIDVARGRFTVDQFNEIFLSRTRAMAGQAAPARGLVLEEVLYNNDSRG